MYSLEGMRHLPRVAILEIGAGEAIPSMRIEAETMARRFLTKVIRINMEEETESHKARAIHVMGDACDVLKQLES
jgi:hypothetical protein